MKYLIMFLVSVNCYAQEYKIVPNELQDPINGGTLTYTLTTLSESTTPKQFEDYSKYSISNESMTKLDLEQTCITSESICFGCKKSIDGVRFYSVCIKKELFKKAYDKFKKDLK